ncbi:MAG: hypothetical protein WAW36_11970 [Methylovulum miyakonense]|uniref:hypothetical protein n=1 Tax=Methylovulum miyakonense TaxID=645578 RepID=UPI003BB5DFEA
MNVTNEISKISVKYHLIVELLLLVAVIFLLAKPSKDITLDTNGLVKNNLLNISLLADGTLVAAHPFANAITTITDENQLNQNSLKQLHSIVIAVTEDGINSERAESGIFDGIISSARATQHNLPGHIYVNITLRSQNNVVCKRYDKTLNMKYVGACI